MALELNMPQGWAVKTISDDGNWDEVNQKVKWGPYFDPLSRTITVTLTRSTPRDRTAMDRGLGTPRPERPLWRGFIGTVSFDGLTQPIRIR